MLDDRLPGIAEKRGEIAGWVEMAKRQGWYVPDDELDAHLPYLTRDCGWDDKTWRANEHSFDLLLELRRAGDARARGRRGEGLGRPAPRSRGA